MPTPIIRTHNAPFATYNYVLPFPPSINSYWKKGWRANITYLSKEAKQFVKDVAAVVTHRPKSARRLEVTIKYQRCYPRKGDSTGQGYDIDNYAKCVLDALAKTDVLVNDQQVDRLVQERLPLANYSKCFVTIREIGYAETRVKVQ